MVSMELISRVSLFQLGYLGKFLIFYVEKISSFKKLDIDVKDCLV